MREANLQQLVVEIVDLLQQLEPLLAQHAAHIEVVHTLLGVEICQKLGIDPNPADLCEGRHVMALAGHLLQNLVNEEIKRRGYKPKSVPTLEQYARDHARHN